MVQVEVVGVQYELPANQPILILKDEDSSRYLPLWIGNSEANAIAISLEGVVPTRPLTHDLLADVIETLGEQLVSVTISELIDGVFYAKLDFTNSDALSARPSDAVALAVRVGVPVYVADDVMNEAALDMPDDDDEFAGESDEVEAFRAFLDEINPEDFSQ